MNMMKKAGNLAEGRRAAMTLLFALTLMVMNPAEMSAQWGRPRQGRDPGYGPRDGYGWDRGRNRPQYPPQFGRYTFRASWGYYHISDYYDGGPTLKVGSRNSGVFSFEAAVKPLRWLEAGAFINYAWKQTWLANTSTDAIQDGSKKSGSVFAVGARVRFNYFNRPFFRLYSGLGVRVGEDTIDGLFFHTENTLLGLSVGNRVFGFGEFHLPPIEQIGQMGGSIPYELATIGIGYAF